MPILAESAAGVPAKTSVVIKIAMVKPMPATTPAPKICVQLTPLGGDAIHSERIRIPAGRRTASS